MAGFGIRAFKKEVDDTLVEEKRTYIKHLVYGENFYSALTFYLLNKKYPGDVKLVTRNPFYKEELLRELNTTLDSIRSEEVASKLTELNPRLEIFPTNTDVHFYKDTKFHKFGGRAKPHELKDGEDFFSKAPYNVDWKNLFDPEDFAKLDTLFREHQLNKLIEKIEITKPDDLVEKTNYKVYSGDGERFECEHLYFCESPKSFFSLIQNKSDLSDTLHKFTTPIVEHSAVSVHFDCEGMVYDKHGTLLLPQSVTHEWGSFVLDFHQFNEAEGVQSFKAMTFVGDDVMTEEELAKKIKLMRRVMERVLPNFAKVKSFQNIRYNSEYRLSGVQDEIANDLAFEHVHFLSHASALNLENSKDYQYLARGVVAILEYLK